MNWNGTDYSPATVYLTTGTSASNVLALQEAFDDFDPNYFQANEYVNYITGNGTANANIASGSPNANYLLTAVVAGAGPSGCKPATPPAPGPSAGPGRSAARCNSAPS